MPVNKQLSGAFLAVLIAGTLGAAGNSRALVVTLGTYDPGGGALQDTTLSTGVSSAIGDGDPPPVVIQPVALPVVGSLTAQNETGHATTAYSLSSSALQISFDHVRGSAAAAESSGTIVFSPEQDVPYAISGIYSLSGNGEIQLTVSFTSYSTADFFQSNQYSSLCCDSILRIGTPSGDSIDQVSGSATGELLAGHLYRFTYDAVIWTAERHLGSATATGSIALTFVPEVDTGTLLLATAAGFAFVRRVSGFHPRASG